MKRLITLFALVLAFMGKAQVMHNANDITTKSISDITITHQPINYTASGSTEEGHFDGIDNALGDYNNLYWIDVFNNDTINPVNSGKIHINTSDTDVELMMLSEANAPHGSNGVFQFMQTGTGKIKLWGENGANFPSIQLDVPNVMLNVIRKGENNWIIATPATYWSTWVSGNPNPELFTGFNFTWEGDTDEMPPNSETNGQRLTTLNSTFNSVDISGNGTDWVLEVVSTVGPGNNSQGIHRFYDTAMIDGETYEYKIRARQTVGVGGRVAVAPTGVVGGGADYNLTSDWVTYSGEFTFTLSEGTDNMSFRWYAGTSDIDCQIGDAIQVELSLKLKND